MGLCGWTSNQKGYKYLDDFKFIDICVDSHSIFQDITILRTNMNLALLVLSQQFHVRDINADFVLKRLRYGAPTPKFTNMFEDTTCRYYGWGSRRNDDVGTVIECSGFARGMMISRLVDRPCGVGFLDLSKYSKFLMYGVDDSRDVVDHDPGMAMEFTSRAPVPTPVLMTVADNLDITE
ncbi:unnamed protein product [Arctia plantaginis]|uniref:Uncharacterized protein n=1 Tax=Arctia plantaginis TaxID=874455 RepID=A0A8S1B668_ARCPL|nr:unnamed protein product [Arctia plantaginis]